MISGQNVTPLPLFEITANGSTESEVFSLPTGADAIILVCKISDLTDGSYVAKLQHSYSKTGDFEDLGSATAALTANGFKISRISVDSLPFLKVVLTASTVTNGAFASVAVFYSNKK